MFVILNWELLLEWSMDPLIFTWTPFWKQLSKYAMAECSTIIIELEIILPGNSLFYLCSVIAKRRKCPYWWNCFSLLIEAEAWKRLRQLLTWQFPTDVFAPTLYAAWMWVGWEMSSCKSSPTLALALSHWEKILIFKIGEWQYDRLKGGGLFPAAGENSGSKTWTDK